MFNFLTTGATRSIELPSEVADMLQAEAKRSHKSVGEFIAQWLEDQADGRDAAKRWKSLESGKTKAIPAAEVYAKLGI